MSKKSNRIRAILEDNEEELLPEVYDSALIGIYHRLEGEGMVPVYAYLGLVESHMNISKQSEEDSVYFVEDNIFPNLNLIVVDDTGV